MIPKDVHAQHRLVFLITGARLARPAVKLLQAGSIPIQYQLSAVGTASSEMIDILGLGSPDKSILITVLPKFCADKLLKKLKKELRLGTRNSGIGFTLPLSGMNHLILRMLENCGKEETGAAQARLKEETAMKEIKHYLITVIVNQGYSEAVMDAAREAGARGGTVVHSRQLGNAEMATFWGLSIQDEKEMVFIVASREHKLDIMKAIGENCGLHSEAKGLVISLPIDSVIGIDLEDGE